MASEIENRAVQIPLFENCNGRNTIGVTVSFRIAESQVNNSLDTGGCFELF